MSPALLTPTNYSRGFLIDEELMAGVTESTETPGQFSGYVLRPETGQYLGYKSYPTLAEALSAINQIPRDWIFERIGGCKNGNCEDGSCRIGGCGKPKSQLVAGSGSAPAPENGCCS